MAIEIAAHEARVLGIDAGGTMTDTIIVDADGEFVVGKAQTTPEDESVGFAASAKDAFGYWGIAAEDGFRSLVSGVYSGTAMLNRLLERKGQTVGVIVTQGMEDYLKLERGVQTYLGYSYADRLHVVTHRHNAPLVDRSFIRGVGGRIDVFGDEVIPLYEDNVRAAVEDLLAAGAECLCVNLLFSYRNPEHERRVRALAEEVMRATGRQVPVFLSSETCPRRLDFPRLNTLIVEAYAAEPSRAQLQKVRASTRELGASFDLRIMAGHGGTVSIEASQLAPTLTSGPIGGVVGGKYLANRLGIDNLACSDIGGTSFDVALITGGQYTIRNDPDIAHFKLNLPLVRIDSLGAGTGSFVRVNPTSMRIEIGPDSAGARIGVCNPGAGLETVSITDCDVVLGMINPDYFLGGEVVLDRDRANRAVEAQIAAPLGISVEDAASGVVELFEDALQQQILAMILGKGYEPVDYSLLSYGGGGPLHVGGYTNGVAFEDVLIPGWAAGFSAFGCACAGFEYRFDRQVDLVLEPDATAEDKVRLGTALNAAWGELKERVAREFAMNSIDRDRITFRGFVGLQYNGQLNDLEVPSPVIEIAGPSDVDHIISAFEELYAQVYARSARSPELGYFVTMAIMVGAVDVEKPVLPEEEPSSPEPPRQARKGTRAVYHWDGWREARIYELERLCAGNVLEGLAIVESPSTTFVIPENRVARLDRHRIFHLEQR